MPYGVFLFVCLSFAFTAASQCDQDSTVNKLSQLCYFQTVNYQNNAAEQTRICFLESVVLNRQQLLSPEIFT